MDYFKSAVIVRDMLEDIVGGTLQNSLSHDIVGNDDPQMNLLTDGVENDGLYIKTQHWGWWDGGLDRIMRDKRSVTMGMDNTLYFRGAAMFGNFDDAKNDYLMNPQLDDADFDRPSFGSEHVPFGMVIPNWVERKDDNPHVIFVSGSDLKSVTIILFWQPLD